MSTYKLYYAGYNLATGLEQIGLATSDDLKVWKRATKNPIIPVGSAGECDAAQTSNPCVLKVGATFKMWYHGKAVDGRTSICYAESEDGVVWQVNHGPVLSAPREEVGVYRAGFQQPHVLYDTEHSTYRMWFTRQTEALATIGYAESSDGRAWTIQKEDILVPAESWEGPYLYYPFVQKKADGSYELWYTSRAPGRRWQSGRAFSHDGIAWTKDPLNPIAPHRLLPRKIRHLADSYLGSFRTFFAKAMNGTGSPFLFETGGRQLMLAHDVGIKGKLSVGLYEFAHNEWRVQKRDILAQGTSEWDSYFQADPYLLIL
jgi:predicted GH43/DUF377 family glycosyl hydrolase